MEAPDGAYSNLSDKIRDNKFLSVDKFKNDCFETYKITHHSKKYSLWNLAWDLGHSNGLHEVLYYFDSLFELLSEE